MAERNNDGLFDQMGNQAKSVYAGAKAAKTAAKATGKIATKFIGKKAMLVFASVFLGLILFTAVVSLMSSLISNSILHISDPEQLSGREDIFEYENSERNREELKLKITTAEATVTAILDEALRRCDKEIRAAAEGNGWTVKSIRYPQTPRGEELVFFYSAYSVSMQNALSGASYEHYKSHGNVGISAMADIDKKLRPLLDMDHFELPYGNYIYGGDFDRDESGAVIIEEVEKQVLREPAEYKDGKLVKEAKYETEIIYYVTAFIDPIDMVLVCEEAFNFSMSDTYDEKYTRHTYGDIIVYQCHVLAEIIYGRDWASEHSGSWGDMAGGWYGDTSGGDYVYAGDLAVDNSSIVNCALSQVGAGGSTYQNWYRIGRSAWCAAFVSWCAAQMGYYGEDGTARDVMPKFSSCTWGGRSGFKAMGRYTSANTGYIPVPGDIIFFNERGTLSTVVEHVGIVVSCDGTNVYTIEGNTGSWPGKVGTFTYSLSGGTKMEIDGYGHPNYPS